MSCLYQQIVNQKLDIPEYQGEPEEIARMKCKLASELVKGNAVMTEDTCLEFNALNGLPGPYIRLFIDKMGVPNLPKLLYAYEDKSARAVCTIGFFDGQEINLFRGEVEGTIVESRGSPDAFGFDLIFQPTGFNETFGEMGLEAKKSISHRTRAFQKLCQHFSK